MNISEHIGELLFANNCVIIPGFGGFVTNYQPARIHPVTHRFDPPSKSIAFNRKLVRSDGLLVNHLAETEALNFEAAEHAVRQFSRDCAERLERDRALLFPSVGKLVLDTEDNWQFNPDPGANYLLEAFGLPRLDAKPILRSSVTVSQPEVILSEEPAAALSTDIELPAPRRGIGTGWLVAAVTLALLLLFQILISTQTIPLQLSDLNFWRSDTTQTMSEARLFRPTTIIDGISAFMDRLGPTGTRAVPSSGDRDTEAAPAADDTERDAGSKSERATDNGNGAPSRPENSPKPSAGDSKAAAGVYIIIGSFSSRSHAEERLTRIPPGSGSTAIVRAPNGNYRAAVRLDAPSSPDREALEKLLTEQRAKHKQPDAWILRLR